MKIFLAVFLTLFLSPLPQAAQAESADTLFAPDHLMQVEITMDPDDWQALRISHRVTGENFTQIVEKPYDYYPATAVIDGREIGEVGIRKKGFFGSAISTRPSLKLKLNYVEEDKKFAGQNRLTFNNNNQDSTRAQTVLVYQFMNDSGVNSPLSNLAPDHAQWRRPWHLHPRRVGAKTLYQATFRKIERRPVGRLCGRFHRERIWPHRPQMG